MKGNSLKAGNHFRFNAATDIWLGSSTHLRIQPGGGGRLGIARQQVHRLEKQFNCELDRYGIDSIAQAATVVNERDRIGQKITNHQSAVTALGDGAFRDIRLLRPDDVSAMSFYSLSGGTREQVAAAVRLAMAEMLAADHDGKLPVDFDDAFAYSDPERAKILQRMLDLAADRGLQVIVLSCNPADYAGLGAQLIRLDAPPITVDMTID